MRRVLVIGGGASGLMAAIAAAEQGAKVTLLEKNRQVGKKILVTGNGRCNLTNENQDEACYRGGEPGFARTVFGNFGLPDTLRFFERLGVCAKSRNGYLYPYSDQASSVADALRMEAERLGVKLALGNQILEIRALNPNGASGDLGRPEEDRAGKASGDSAVSGPRFAARTEGWTYEGDACVLAAGSAAAPATGSDGSGYALAKSLGHRIIKPLPALVALRCRERFFERLAGLRMEASVRILADGKELARDWGEVQFTKTGISGIPVFQVSRWGVRALDAGKEVCAVLNLLPLFSKEQLLSFLEQRRKCSSYKTGKQFLVGIFPEKLIPVLLERAKSPKEKPVGDWRKEELASLAQVIGGFSLTLRGFGSFSQAQVCSGGVDTASVNGKTMESRLVPGLYFAGELLDIDGACGGYNLQWAWSTGALAGRFAAERVTG